MKSLEPAFPESIDDILAAVRETPRGRWFLQSYETKLRAEETSKVLTSIEKLESVVKSMAVSTPGLSPDSAVLAQARQAIAQAKRDVQSLQPETPELSAEGQLFAKLAEVSRQAFETNPPPYAKGVERALRLVSDLERDLAPGKPATSYFKQDEAIFAPAPVKAFAAPEAPLSAESPGKGAKLTIRKVAHLAAVAVETPPPQMRVHEPENRVAPETPPDVMTVTTSVPAASPEDEKSRIVIIRRKVEDMTELPMPEAGTLRADPLLDTVSAA